MSMGLCRDISFFMISRWDFCRSIERRSNVEPKAASRISNTCLHNEPCSERQMMVEGKDARKHVGMCIPDIL
jgi:hypothetical protein